MIGSIFIGFLVVFSGIVPGRHSLEEEITLVNCVWSAFNRDYTYWDKYPGYFATTKYSGYTARIVKDTTTYTDGDWWVVGWGFKYNGNYHQMACGKFDIMDCNRRGDWWYWYNGWYKDESCAVYPTSAVNYIESSGTDWNVGASASSSGSPTADDQAQGPIPIDSGDDAQSFDDFIPIIIGAAVGVMVVTAIVTVVVVKRKRKRVSNEEEVEMKEVVSAPNVSPAVSTDGVDDTV